ncbi:MAG: DUF3114 domain-containing protein [Clostridiales bacterium]|nr:DUF3114 domain-containing protein [Clostridiales bacterium]
MERQRGKNGISKTNRYRTARQTAAALLKEGWDDPAVKVMLQAVEDRMTKQTGQDGSGQGGSGQDGLSADAFAALCEETAAEVRRVGSALYTDMFAACGLPDAEKALLPIMQMGGSLDEDNILQLPGALLDNGMKGPEILSRFDPELAPDGRFLDVYSAAVVRGYPQGLSLGLAAKAKGCTDSAKLGDTEDLATAMRMVHQFRMYIDRQNLRWVRAHYPDAPTDLARLLAYDNDLQAAGSKGLYFGEPSRYHNKLHLAEVFFRQINDKIETGDRHSEFIVDTDTGMFVSQWDVLRIKGPQPRVVLPADIGRDAAAQRRLLNSESFNYATGPKHLLFDVLPAAAEADKSLDYTLKQQLKSGADWREVERSEYTEMFKKKEHVEGVVYTDIESISGTSRRETKKRKKEAKKAKEQMKVNRKKQRAAKVTMTENGIILATIAVLVAGAGLVIWQTIMDAKQDPVPANQTGEEAE